VVVGAAERGAAAVGPAMALGPGAAVRSEPVRRRAGCPNQARPVLTHRHHRAIYAAKPRSTGSTPVTATRGISPHEYPLAEPRTPRPRPPHDAPASPCRHRVLWPWRPSAVD